MPGTREDMYRVSVKINDTWDVGVWDEFEGGGVTSDELKYNPGGMGPQESLGGRVTVENVTVRRNYKLERDHVIIKDLIAQAGKGTATITKQPLDTNKMAWGDPLVYSGKIMTVTPPNANSNAASTAAMLEMIVSTDGTVG